MEQEQALKPTPGQDNPLPSFAAPPVRLVAFALLLDPVPLLGVHMGLLWAEKFRVHYPSAEDRAPLVNQLEQFGGDPFATQFQVRIMPGVPTGQVLFRAPDLGLSLGVQRDRLTFTWERPEPSAVYPRYPALRTTFERDAEAFATFCVEQALGEPSLRQIEMLYINILDSGRGWDRPGELHRVLRPWNPDFSPALGEPEDVRISQRHIAERDGAPYGRLHIAVEPNVQPGAAAALQMSLTFRGEPPEYSLPGIMTFLDDGHDRIVRAFTAATTSEMHEVWGRQQ